MALGLNPCILWRHLPRHSVHGAWAMGQALWRAVYFGATVLLSFAPYWLACAVVSAGRATRVHPIPSKWLLAPGCDPLAGWWCGWRQGVVMSDDAPKAVQGHARPCMWCVNASLAGWLTAIARMIALAWTPPPPWGG